MAECEEPLLEAQESMWVKAASIDQVASPSSPYKPCKAEPGQDLREEGVDTGRSVVEHVVQGKFGGVSKVLNKKEGEVEAMKTVALKEGRGFSSTEAERLARLAPHVDEADVMARLGVHPNLVALKGAYLLSGNFYVFAETVSEARSLLDTTQTRRTTPAVAATVAIKIARGLQHMHERGLTHWDLKPRNVLVEAAGIEAALEVEVPELEPTIPEKNKVDDDDKKASEPRSIAAEPAEKPKKKKKPTFCLCGSSDQAVVMATDKTQQQGQQGQQQGQTRSPAPQRQRRADISPAFERLVVKIADFGSASSEEPRAWTARYAAPETLAWAKDKTPETLEKAKDARHDEYSLAMALQADMLPKTCQSGLVDHCRALALSCLDADPKKRPRIGEVIARLETGLADRAGIKLAKVVLDNCNSKESKDPLGIGISETATVHSALGGAYQTLLKRGDADLEKAERHLRMAVELRKTEKPVNASPAYASSLNALALLLQDQKKYDQAKVLYEEAIELAKKTNPDHPNLAARVNNLAGVLRAQGKLSEARDLYQKALEMREKALPENHPDIAQALNNLAVVTKDLGDYETARPLYERALDVTELALGEDHALVATRLDSLANLLQAQGKNDEAVPLLARSIAIGQKTLGPNHPGLATRLLALAGLLEDQGMLAEAQPLYERAIEIDEKALGKDSAGVATDLNNFAGLLESMGKHFKAKPLYERAVKIGEQKLPPDHPDMALWLNNLALVLWRIKRAHDAIPYQERALGIRERCGDSDLAAELRRDLEGLKAGESYPYT